MENKELTSELAEKILTTLASGKGLLAACELNGVSASELSEWEQQTLAGKEPYVQFMRDVHTASLQAIKDAKAKLKQDKAANTGTKKVVKVVKKVSVTKRTK